MRVTIYFLDDSIPENNQPEAVISMLMERTPNLHESVVLNYDKMGVTYVLQGKVVDVRNVIVDTRDSFGAVRYCEVDQITIKGRKGVEIK